MQYAVHILHAKDSDTVINQRLVVLGASIWGRRVLYAHEFE